MRVAGEPRQEHHRRDLGGEHAGDDGDERVGALGERVVAARLAVVIAAFGHRRPVKGNGD